MESDINKSFVRKKDKFICKIYFCYFFYNERDNVIKQLLSDWFICLGNGVVLEFYYWYLMLVS